MSNVKPADVDARLRALAVELEQRTLDLAGAKADVQRARTQWQFQAEQILAVDVAEADRALVRDKKAIEANSEELRSSACTVAEATLARFAPGCMSADWDDSVWTELVPPSGGQWLRIGSVAVGDDRLPMALPLSAGVWRVVAPEMQAIKGFVHNVLVRLVAAFDPTRIRVVAYDPNLELDLGAFAGLRTVSAGSVPPAITSETEFESALEVLRAEVGEVDDRLTAAGLDTYWSALSSGHELSHTTPLRVVLIAGDVNRLTDRGVSRLEQLCRLAADRGVLVIKAANVPEINGPQSDATITLSGERSTNSLAPGVAWTPDEWAGDRFVRSLAAGLVHRPRESLAPTVSFERIVAGVDDAWMADADEGLETVIGSRNGGDLVMRLRSENPPMPNALIGGAVGQGKSNLLHVVIHGLAVRYSPAELQMVLVDLKDGVEFARFGPRPGNPTWLPHVRALGLEFDPDFSLAALRWVEAQRADRSRLLKDSGTSSLRGYRQKTGKTIPRLLLVIDEFQRLFEGDDEQAAAAAALLEGIARTGRSYGIHLVLASQAITGIRGLATKADAIFSQFHNRVTMRNTATESQAFLAAQNLAATQLEHRGEVVLNDALGAIDANVIGTVAYAEGDFLDRLQVQLFQQGHGSAPSVFRSSAFALWPGDAPPVGLAVEVVAAVGMPIDIECEPRRVRLTRSPNQVLAVVGSNREIAVSVLVRAVSTAARSLGQAARVLVLDGFSSTQGPTAWLASLVDDLAQNGMSVERVDRAGVANALIELAATERAADLVVAVGLDSVDLSTATGPDYRVPSDALRDLAKSGPLNGTWTIGWWQSKSVLEEHLGYRAQGVRAWAFAGVSREDLTDIAGHGVREPIASPRFVWFDRTSGMAAERLVPFAPADLIGDIDLV